METWEWVVIAGAAAAALPLLLAFRRIRRRRSRLENRFGTEYQRAVSDTGRRTAERRLSQVERLHDELALKALSAAARDRYLEEWRQAETRFVSDPRDAVRAAERVVERALEDRGYPAEIEVEEKIDLVAVDHPDIAERYRHGRAMLESADNGQSTENLRKAMVDLRVVLEEVLEERTAA